MKDKADIYIKEMLKGVKIDMPSENFTKNVMSQIIIEESLIIKKQASFFNAYKFAIVISLTFLSISLLVFFFADYNEVNILSRFDINFSGFYFMEKIRDFFKVVFKFSSIHLVVIASAFVLFLLDTILQRIRLMKQ